MGQPHFHKSYGGWGGFEFFFVFLKTWEEQTSYGSLIRILRSPWRSFMVQNPENTSSGMRTRNGERYFAWYSKLMAGFACVVVQERKSMLTTSNLNTIILNSNIHSLIFRCFARNAIVGKDSGSWISGEQRPEEIGKDGLKSKTATGVYL